MVEIKSKTVAIIVAHPDDETLWAGGTILSHPAWNCFIISLCRGNDTNRAPRFYEALKILKSEGIMGDMDDGPNQVPLNIKDVEEAILSLLPPKHFDLIISHNPSGEYTRHIRHEEVGEAVINLWNSDKILTSEIRLFAYEDGQKTYYPKAVQNAAFYFPLTKRIWQRKFNIITKTYGFDKESWEAKTSPVAEAFWRFTHPFIAKKWLNQIKNEKQ
jgi:LmbE family N-acetylglucosaminyl deacetylase